MNDVYDEFSELLGAYALDAVEPDERARIERHLMECPRCRAEVAEHREVASFLAQSGTDAPEGVWDRIAAELSPPAPPMRLSLSPREPVAPARPEATAPTGSGHDGTVASLDVARRSRSSRSKTLLGLLAAAACIVAVLGFVTVGQSQRLNKLEDAMSERTIEGMANDVVADSGSVKVSLSGDAGSAEAVVGESGQGFLIMDDLPLPPEGDLYQLWGQVDGTILSLGTFGGGSSVVPFSVDPARLDDIELFAVTQEKAPGVVSSQNPAVLAGTV